MTLTAHASKRMQQRAIPTVVLELLERFGSERRCSEAYRLFFDKAARKRLRSHMGGPRSIKHIEQWLNVYVVIGDNGKVVTAAHRTRRVPRH